MEIFMKKVCFSAIIFLFLFTFLLHASSYTLSPALKKDKDGFLSFDPSFSARKEYAYELNPPLPGRPAEVLIRPKSSTRIRFVFEKGEVFNMHLEIHPLRATVPADKRNKIEAKNLVLTDAIIHLKVEPYAHPFNPQIVSQFFVKPDIRNMAPAEVAKLNLAKLPKASEHTLKLAVKLKDGKSHLYLDGSFAGILPFGRLRQCQIYLKGRESIKEITKNTFSNVHGTLFEQLDLSHRASSELAAKVSLDEKLPFFISENITHALDLRECRNLFGSVKGYAECDRTRYAFDGFTSSRLFSMPLAQYNKAYILCAPLPVKNPKEYEQAFSLRITRYAPFARSMVQMPGNFIDFTGKSPDVKKVGSAKVKVDGKEVSIPLYLAGVELDHNALHNILFTNTIAKLPFSNYLDVEFQEGKEPRRLKDRNRKKASVAVFALTLERTPVVLQEVQKSKGNIFEGDEPFHIGLTGTAEKAGEYLLKYDVYTLEGKKVLSKSRKENFSKGEKRDISIVEKFSEKGYFEIKIGLYDASGRKTAFRNSSFVMLQENTRKATREESPFMQWLAGKVHLIPMYNKLGILNFSSSYNMPEKDVPNFHLVQFPDLIRSIYPDKSVLTADEEAWKKMDNDLLYVLGQYVKRFPNTRRILLYHESYPNQYGVIPNTILNKEPRKFDAKREKIEQARVKAATRYCKMIRKHFPHLKIIFGNSCYAQEMLETYAARGFDKTLIDFVGSEGLGSWHALPESFSFWNPCGSSYILRETALANGYKAPVTATYEWCCRGSNPVPWEKSEKEGFLRQAREYARDLLIAFSFGYENIPIQCGQNADTSYGDGRTYGSDGGFNVDLLPKPSIAMFGTITRILDQAKFIRMMPDMPFVYCYEFVRKDGKYVYAYWTADRIAECRFTFANDQKIVREDLYGRRSILSPVKNSFTATGNNVPQYFISKSRMLSARILSRKFDLPAAPEKKKILSAIPLITENFLVTNEEDFFLSKQKEEERHPFKIKNRIPAKVSSYMDKDKGKTLKIAFDVSSLPQNDRWNHGGYTVIRFKTPMDVPRNTDYLGIWVKGNDSMGRFAWEVTDQKGRKYVSHLGYRNELKFGDWQFLSMPLNPQLAGGTVGFGYQWMNPNRIKSMYGPVKITGIVVSTTVKREEIFRLGKVEKQEILLGNAFAFRK